MKNITFDAESNLAELKSALEKADAFLKTAPEGRINISERGGKKYYQHVVKNPDGTSSITYTKDWKLVSELNYKRYCEKTKPKLIKNIKALELFLNKYSPSEIDLEYSKLHSARKSCVKPLIPNVDYLRNEWESEIHDVNDSYPKPKGFVTVNGEEVRSKSELIIANELASRKETHLYHYEPVLYLTASGIEVHPDFSIFNLKSGNIYYWEHFGMLDNPEYANKFTNKLNNYILSGYLPGRELVITTESSVWHLNTSVISKIIDTLV